MVFHGNLLCVISKIFLAAAAPATYNAAGYAALTWIEIGEVTDIGENGPESSQIDHAPLSSGVKIKRKGIRDYGNIPLQMALVPGDEGQQEMILAEASQDAWSIKMVYQDETIDYTRALVMSFKKNIGNSESITAASSTLCVTKETITVEPA